MGLYSWGAGHPMSNPESALEPQGTKSRHLKYHLLKLGGERLIPDLRTKGRIDTR